MEISDANSSNARREVGQESSRTEPWPQYRIQILQSRRKTEKRWQDEVHDFLRPEGTEEATSNQDRKNDAWIKTESKFAMATASASWFLAPAQKKNG